MNIFKKAYMHFAKKIAFSLINGLYCGKYGRFYEKKRKLLNRAGFHLEKGVKIVGPLFCTTELYVGENTHIGAFFKCTGSGKVYIGNNVDIAPEVSIETGGHEIGNHCRRAGKGNNKDVHIGDGVWIGQRVLILQDVKVEDGCVLGAGSIVIKSTEKDSLYAGNPARQIKKYE